MKRAISNSGIAFAILLFVGLPFVPRGYKLKLSGNGSACTWSEIRDMNSRRERLDSAERAAVRASKLTRSDPAGYHLWSTPAGDFWVPAGSDAPDSGFRLPFREIAEQQMDIYEEGFQTFHANDVVLDCGANIGIFTRRALEAGAGTVVAIEPGPENIECLRRNFEKEIASGRVILYPKGVWDRDDTLSFHIVPNTSAGDTLLNRPGPVLQVPVTTIDHLVAELHLPHVTLIKMDIEGSEPQALVGAMATLRREHPRLVIAPEHFPGEPAMVSKLLHGVYAHTAVGACELNPGGFLVRESLLAW